jgi:hypothetical protein
MKKLLLSLVAAVANPGCGDSPPPKPVAKPPPPAVQPTAPKPEVKAPAPAPVAAPAPDPNKELAARVKHALESEAKIQAGGIDVTAEGGKVTLWGTAASAGERSRAARAAAKVDGVKSVENKLAVVKGS